MASLQLCANEKRRWLLPASVKLQLCEQLVCSSESAHRHGRISAAFLSKETLQNQPNTGRKTTVLNISNTCGIVWLSLNNTLSELFWIFIYFLLILKLEVQMYQLSSMARAHSIDLNSAIVSVPHVYPLVCDWFLKQLIVWANQNHFSIKTSFKKHTGSKAKWFSWFSQGISWHVLTLTQYKLKSNVMVCW